MYVIFKVRFDFALEVWVSRCNLACGKGLVTCASSTSVHSNLIDGRMLSNSYTMGCPPVR